MLLRQTSQQETPSSQCCCTAVHSQKPGAWKKLQGIWRTGFNWWAGRSSATPVVVPYQTSNVVTPAFSHPYSFRVKQDDFKGRLLYLEINYSNKSNALNHIGRRMSMIAKHILAATDDFWDKIVTSTSTNFRNFQSCFFRAFMSLIFWLICLWCNKRYHTISRSYLFVSY